MPIDQQNHPCWIVTCDRCGEHPYTDEWGTPHYDTPAEAEAGIADVGMIRAHGWIVCHGCFDNASYERACPACTAAPEEACDRKAATEDPVIEDQHRARIEAWIADEKQRDAERQAQIAEADNAR